MYSYIGVYAKKSLSLCDFIDTSMISAAFGKIVKYQISGKSFQ